MENDEFIAVLQEYNARLAQLEHENIMLRVENNRMKRMVEETRNESEDEK